MNHYEQIMISLTPSLTAFRLKNALHAMQVNTPKLKPIDLSPQTQHGSSCRDLLVPVDGFSSIVDDYCEI